MINISLKLMPKGRIYNIPAFVQIMAWCRLGEKPLSEPIMVNLLTHICLTLPQWIKNPCPWHMLCVCMCFAKYGGCLEGLWRIYCDKTLWIILPPISWFLYLRRHNPFKIAHLIAPYTASTTYIAFQYHNRVKQCLPDDRRKRKVRMQW